MYDDIKLDAKGQALFDLLWQIPPDLEGAKAMLERGDCPAEQVSRVGARFAEECLYDIDDLPERNFTCVRDSETEPILHTEVQSAYLPQVTELLLSFGLDPNGIYSENERNIMLSLKYNSNGYAAADTMALLLSHGGRWDLEIAGEKLFDEIDFDVIFDAIEQEDHRKFDALVHVWMVMLGFGAKLEDGKSAVDLFPDLDDDNCWIDFDIAKLKNHRNYKFGLSRVESRGEKWSLHIFDRQTHWEVARL